MTDDSPAVARDPRAELAAKAIAAGLTIEAATVYSRLAKLSAETTGAEVNTEFKRIIAEAKDNDFEAGHAGQQRAFLLDLKLRLTAQRAQEDRTKVLDERLNQGGGSDLAELDRRLGLGRRS